MNLKKTLLLITLAGGLAAGPRVWADDTADAISALRQQIQDLDQKVRILERQKELDTETTEAKAKELRPFVEKLITKARSGTLHARRLAVRHIHKRETADKLFQELGPKFARRAGGYTRILKTGHRKGDGAEMARIELIEA